MVIGVLYLELLIPDSRSLKGKRMILKSLKQRVRNRFNVSVAELDGGDMHRRTTLGIAILTNGSRYANRVLSSVLSFVERERAVEILDHSIQVM